MLRAGPLLRFVGGWSYPAPMKFRELPSAADLTPEERARWCNGIGPRAGAGLWSKLFCGFLRLFIVLTGLASLFDSCGDDHDLWYALGGNEDDWLIYDLAFLGNCLSIKKRAPWPLHPLVNSYSWAMFKAVQIGGGFGPFSWRNRALSLEELRATVSEA